MSRALGGQQIVMTTFGKKQQMVIWVLTDEDEAIAVTSLGRPYHSEPEICSQNYFRSASRVSKTNSN